MYQASSTRRRDVDGMITVRCRECGDFICRTYVRMNNVAVCALCERVLSGQPLTAEAIADYRKGKDAAESITLVDMSQYNSKPDGTFKLRTMGGNIMRALGLAKPKQPELESVKVAKSKRKPRIFADNQPGEQGLGSITELDAELQRQKEKGL